MTDQLISPTEWRAEFPVQWTAVQPDAAPEPAPTLLIPSQRTSPEISPSIVITLPDAVTTPRAPDPRRTKPSSFESASPRTRRRVVAVEGILSLAVAGTGIAVAMTSGGSSTTTVHGVITISSAITPTSVNFVGIKGGTCVGLGEYADLKPGAAVAVINANGTAVATSQLGQGSLVGGSCQFSWQASKVAKQSIYRVVIARRGIQIFTRQQLGTGFNTDVGR